MNTRESLLAVVSNSVTFIQEIGAACLEAGYAILFLPFGATTYEHIKRYHPQAIVFDLTGTDDQTNGWLLDALLHEPALASIPMLICYVAGQMLEGRAAQLRALGFTLIERPPVFDQVLGWLRATVEPPDQQPVVREAPSPRATIVVAEDDLFVNDLLREVLSDEGFEVLACTSRSEAEEVAQQARPDLVITDMHMETPDAGLRLLQHLRQRPETAAVSVIICSADETYLTARKQVIERYQAEIVPKPFHIDRLIRVVHRLLTRSR